MASSARIDELRKKFDENPRRYFAPLANEYRKAGDLEQAIFICQEYLPQQPGHMSGHIVYGQALFELARLDEARAVFETALSLDPENLIALRHLGDIARQAGDSKAARIWYQRVLEADPRNEEIAQLMLTLLGTPQGSQSAIPPGYGTPINAPAIDFSDLDEPEESLSGFSSGSAVSDSERGFRVEKSEDRSDLTVGPELSALPERQPPATPPTPAWGGSSSIVPPHELMDLDDLTVGGVQLSSLGMSPAVEPPSPEPFPETSFGEDFAAEPPEEGEFTESSDAFVSSSSPDVSAEFARGIESQQPTEEEFDLEKDDDTFQPDSFAIAAGSGDLEDIESRTELASDIVLGLPDDGSAPSLTDPNDDAFIGEVMGLETFEEGVIGPVVEEPTALELESFFDAMPPSSPVEDIVATSSVADESIAGDRVDFYEPIASEPVADEPAAYEPEPFEPESYEPVGYEPIAEEPEPFEPVADESRVEEPIADVPVEGLGAAAWVADEPVADERIADEPVAPEPEVEPAAAPVGAAGDDQEMLADGGVGFVEPESAEAFVTETMAELYLQQGHVDSALEIYQRLVEQRPNEPQLQERLRAIEGLVRGTSMAAETEAFEGTLPATDEADDRSEPPVSPGPTIREFLVGLIRPQAAFADENFTSRYDEDVPSSDGDASASSMSRATPLSSGTISGSIDALFTGADASSSDASAATTLAQAFAAEGPDTAALQGVPAHKASSELSLDHVFKSTQAPRPGADSGGFSFDQFFADDLAEPSTKPGNEPPAPAGDGSDDIAQFNNWLNGLKKT